MTTDSLSDFAAAAQDAVRLAYGPEASLPVRHYAIALRTLAGQNPRCDRIGQDFAPTIWILTHIMRSRGAGPTLVLVPSADADTFIDANLTPIARLGLRFGSDVIVHGILGAGAGGIGTGTVGGRTGIGPGQDTAAGDQNPAVTGPLASFPGSELGLVVLLGRSVDGRPGTCHPGLAEWLSDLPPTVTVLRCWEAAAQAPNDETVTSRNERTALAAADQPPNTDPAIGPRPTPDDDPWDCDERRRDGTLSVEHLNLDAVPAGRPITTQELGARLREQVRGQDQAIATVAGTLAPALAGLKLRPERPHAVFLFAGPTGVGKTELAKQLAQVVYGSPNALIRLDMSEFTDAQDAQMKLIGASKIWKDSTTEGLLTTKVRERPRSVVLLDEFEKSSPFIWPLFLQVFDEGRLTNGWGYTASFAETIVIMTSNLGVREGNTRAAGFGSDQGFSADRQLEAIKGTLPPEFLNRITATVFFGTLTEEAIHELAVMEIERLTARLADSGWSIDCGPEVAQWLARTGYDPLLGARHLQRNIERELLPLLAAAPTRNVHVTAGPQGLVTTGLPQSAAGMGSARQLVGTRAPSLTNHTHSAG